MNVEIFYLDDQEDLVAGLGEELRKQVYPGLAVKLQSLSSTQLAVIDMGQRYVKLLQASIRPEKGFELSLAAFEHFGYRFYIYVYYAFAYYGAKKIERLSGLLPAVAVRNRMMLVPSGLGRDLEWAWNDQLSSPFIALEMGGAAEVDFRNRAAVDQSLAQIGRRMRADLLQEMRAYTSYRSLAEVDLTTLARDLDVDIGFAQHLLKTGAADWAFYGQLTCELDRQKIPLGRWTRVSLSIRNDSDVSLPGLIIKIAGPVEIRPTRLQADVPPRSTRKVPIALKPNESGEFPLEVVLALPDDRVFTDWLPIQHLWLECG